MAKAKKRKKKASGRTRVRAADLRARISQFRSQRDGPIPAREAVAVIDDILSAGKRVNARSRKLRGEIRRLSEFIHAARAGIVSVKTAEVKKEFIPTATDELDAIIEATATATNAIMDATETIDKVAGTLTGEGSAQLAEVTTKIFEACGFQDITGQRITKVVKALKQIEERVDALVAAFGVEAGARPAKVEEATKNKPKDGAGQKPITDADLLEGPQLKSAAKTQEEIDALLFGTG